jgi:hypothetical protein
MTSEIAQGNAEATCTVMAIAERTHADAGWSWRAILISFEVGAIFALTVVWHFACLTCGRKKKKKKVTQSTQSQVKYTRWTEHPRFTPSTDWEHGWWLDYKNPRCK